MPGFLHLSQGEDAVAVGTCANLGLEDAIYTTHRGHGCIIAKGADLKPMMAELFGRIAGCCKGRAGSMHFADVTTGCMGSNGVVGEGMRIALGTAFAQKYNKTDNVTAVFFGEGATGTGSFHESFNRAAVLHLPLIFVCSINLYAQMTPKTDHIAIENVAERAVGYGAPGVTFDGNDVDHRHTGLVHQVGKRSRIARRTDFCEGRCESKPQHECHDEKCDHSPSIKMTGCFFC